MFNRKIIKDLRSEVKELESKILRMEDSYENLQRLLRKTEDDKNKLWRIIRNYVPGKITYINNSEYVYGYYGRDIRCNIYKDGREYEIKNLELADATIEEISPGVVRAKEILTDESKMKEFHEYAIDLDSGSFVKLK